MKNLKNTLAVLFSATVVCFLPVMANAHSGHGLDGSVYHSWLHSGEWMPLAMVAVAVIAVRVLVKK